MNFKFPFLIICISVILYSCKKDNLPDAPVVTLTSPADTTIINAGDTVLLQGTVSDNKSLHEVYISLTNSTDTIFSAHPFTHGLKNFPFAYHWITAASGNYIFTVTAEDHENHTTVKEFSITVH